MKIAATSVSMDAARTYREVEQHISGWSLENGQTKGVGQRGDFALRLTRSLHSQTSSRSTSRSSITHTPILSPPLPANIGIETKTAIGQMAEQLLGRPLTISAMEDNSHSPLAAGTHETTADGQVAAHLATFFTSTVYRQEETLMFSAQGTVQTTDGREIAFDLGLSMERSTVAAWSAEVDAANLFIDPLILRFDGNAPLLADASFLFDLDADGTEEKIACPGSGCGFLAFDRNGDGQINNGFELFGPKSGAGFAELAELDSDANQWLDDNDPLFAKLLVWHQNGEGKESLLSLKEAGIGAIHVVHAGTAFQLTGSDGAILGAVKASGLFLTEDGKICPLQEIDLALPGTTSFTGFAPDDQKASGRQLEAAIQSLQAIINMQRFRLKMLLTGRRLHNMVTQQLEEERKWRLPWFFTKNDNAPR